MKKIIIILVFYCSLLISNYSFSQSGWVQINTGLNRNLGEIFFLNENTGFCVSDSATIFKTTNGGINWTGTIIYSNPKLGLNNIKFADAYTGYATGTIYDVNAYYRYQRFFFKTTDQGAYWMLLEAVPGDYYEYYSSISMINRDTIFLSLFGQYDTGPSYGNVRKSHNGGLNYSGYYYSGFGGFTGISFINFNTGWASAYCANDIQPHYWDFIYKTTNSGVNWVRQYVDSVNAVKINKITFLDANTGYALCGINFSSPAKLFKTINGGVNWILNSLPFTHSFYSMFFVNQNTGWICGGWSSSDSTTIARTTDGGQTFQKQRKLAVNDGINYLYFLNSQTGFATGGTKFLKTTTGGVTFVNNISGEIPDRFSLSQNYPNPFNPNTIIRFKIPKLSSPHVLSGDPLITLKVYNILGKEITTFINEKLKPGEYEVTFDGSNLPSGVYFYKLQSGDFTDTKKLVLLK